ncbi:hypothetical protein CIPAW_07G187300 [Carya illinoinensis]|uniref:Uncharacterized protein n=1 Tax=Carya illinoinensis TaxID=32201 RepID=A0A8T1PX04_CARIL|nr:hypothetical protein CIPAW_07G187300 [Carya illinoinensis]
MQHICIEGQHPATHHNFDLDIQQGFWWWRVTGEGDFHLPFWHLSFVACQFGTLKGHQRNEFSSTLLDRAKWRGKPFQPLSEILQVHI